MGTLDVIFPRLHVPHIQIQRFQLISTWGGLEGRLWRGVSAVSVSPSHPESVPAGSTAIWWSSSAALLYM